MGNMIITDSGYWWEDHRNIYLLLEWLRGNSDSYDGDMAIDVVEKPWKWDDEYQEALAEIEQIEVDDNLPPARRPDIAELQQVFDAEVEDVRWADDAPVDEDVNRGDR